VLGTIAGDIIGLVYEARAIKYTRFPLRRHGRFTDDTVGSVAVAPMPSSTTGTTQTP
jgi:ADP-ribosylglycohydrolase